MIFEFNDYRMFLKQVMVDRQSKNPHYSLGAFAGQLDLAPSTLSEVISKKKNLSIGTATEVAYKLGLKDREVDYFCLLVQIGSAKKEELKVALLQRLHSLNPKRIVHDLSIDVFKFMSDWYHLAVLGTLGLENFEFSPENLSKSLGITKLEAETAIERLLRLELIERDSKGRYKRLVNDLFLNTPVSNTSVNNYFQQMLRKASEAIEKQQPLKERVFRTENIIIDEKQLPQADLLIEEFYSKMAALTAKAKKKSKLYHLGTQFFCLTKAGGKKS